MGAPASSLGWVESVGLCKDSHMVVISFNKHFRSWHCERFGGKFNTVVRSTYASYRMVVDFWGVSTSVAIANLRWHLKEEIMKRYLIPILVIFVLVSGLSVSCSPGLQTFSKYDISFEVSRELKWEESAVNFAKQSFARGTANSKQGAVMSSEKNFMLLWLTTIPKFTQEEVRRSIFTTPDTFESASGTFRAKIAGDLVAQEIAGFEVTSAAMQFTMPQWEALGITAVWYCPASQKGKCRGSYGVFMTQAKAKLAGARERGR